MKKALLVLLILSLCLTGFCQTMKVTGRFLYDHTGKRVILVGVNSVRITWQTSATAVQLEAAI